MVQITFVAAIAALTGYAMAQDIGAHCDQRQAYCGSHLLSGNGANFTLWQGRIDAALVEAGKPVNSNTEFNSLFVCINPDTIVFVEQCTATASRTCQRSQNDQCKNGNALNKDDCCGKA